MNRAESSRANGARSNGPATDEGKAKSSLNSIKHGLTSSRLVVLPDESVSAYQDLAADYADTFLPANQVEAGQVQIMINSIWKRQRAEAMETAILTIGLAAAEKNLDQKFQGEIDTTARLALAYCESYGHPSRALANLERQTTRLSREFHRAHDKLKELQADRKLAESETRETPANPAETADFPNEPERPEPAPETSGETASGPAPDTATGWTAAAERQPRSFTVLDCGCGAKGKANKSEGVIVPGSPEDPCADYVTALATVADTLMSFPEARLAVEDAVRRAAHEWQHKHRADQQ